MSELNKEEQKLPEKEKNAEAKNSNEERAKIAALVRQLSKQKLYH